MEKPGLKFGITQVYTGEGKGKTTAAFGLALRAIGRGLKVYVIQFIKGGFDYGELHIVKELPRIKLAAYGRGQFIEGENPTEEDMRLAREAFEHAKKVVQSKEYDIVVLDEINVAISLKLLEVEEVLALIEDKPEKVELVLTGRGAPYAIIEAANLVTEMVEIKHPFNEGVGARKGIEY